MHSSTNYKEDDERVSYFVGIIEKHTTYVRTTKNVFM